ncbi:unnamed protein product, partial [Clonostachys rhizophaga]
DYSYTQNMMPQSGLYSFQTETSADLLPGSTWGTSEGAQNFQDLPDSESCHSGEAEEYIVTSGQATPRGTRLERSHANENAWASGLTPVIPGGHAMSRIPSNMSNGSSLSHSSRLSSLDVRGNVSTFRNGSQLPGPLVGVDTSCLFLDTDASLMPPSAYWPTYDLTTGLESQFSLSTSPTMHVVPSQMQFGPDASLPDNSSPGSWNSFSSSISRTSSPATIDEAWLQSAHRPLSPHSSPELPCQSPSIGIKNEMPEDLVAAIPSLGDNLGLPAAFGPRRDGETARNHELYKNATPKEDGLYHCPWEGETCCNHRPEKLKCNYDKFVDSHLKPYRCKAEACEGARFSSTACLLRHEREAHGLHGHGDKPFLCQYEGCERGVPGNGFPRQWNLKDHMKRVHNDHGSAGGSPPSTAAPQSTKGRKRKTDSSEPQGVSRKASQKSIPPKEKVPAAKPLIEEWLEQRKAVEDLLRTLEKPEDANNLNQIGEIQKRLNTMGQMASKASGIPTQDINPVAHVQFTSTSG